MNVEPGSCCLQRFHLGAFDALRSTHVRTACSLLAYCVRFRREHCKL